MSKQRFYDIEKKRKVNIALEHLSGKSAEEIAEIFNISLAVVLEELEEMRVSLLQKSSQQKIELFKKSVEKLNELQGKALFDYEEMEDNPNAKVSNLRLARQIELDKVKLAMDLNVCEDVDDQVRRRESLRKKSDAYTLSKEIRMVLIEAQKLQKLTPLAEPETEDPENWDNVNVIEIQAEEKDIIDRGDFFDNSDPIDAEVKPTLKDKGKKGKKK